jgi:hypothetical protein
MVASLFSPLLLEYAASALMRRWSISPHDALAAISEAAEELDLEVGDMAALVAASEQQLRLQQRSWSLQSGIATGWVMRNPEDD